MCVSDKSSGVVTWIHRRQLLLETAAAFPATVCQNRLTNKRSMCYTIPYSHSRVHNWISEWNSRQLPKGIAAAPLLSQRLPAGRKKQTLKVSEFQSRYIVSSKIWREIISRWFDVRCTGSFCRYSHRSQKVYKNSFVQTAKKFPVDYWGG